MAFETGRRVRKVVRVETGDWSPPSHEKEIVDVCLFSKRLKLLQFSFCCRVFIISLQVLVNWLIPDWPHSVKEAFQTPKDFSSYSTADQVVEFLFGGLARWDAEYFVHIATSGYSMEQAIAFFPGWPYLLRETSRLFTSVLSERPAILLAGVLLNLVFSVASVDALFRLTTVAFDAQNRRTKRRYELAYYAAALFAACPALIYFSALYTEPLFAWVTFEGLYWLYKHESFVVSSILFFIGSLTRANGIVSAIFLVHFGLSKFRDGWRVWYLLKGVIFAAFAASPFILVQMWHVATFCDTTVFEQIVRPVRAAWCPRSLAATSTSMGKLMTVLGKSPYGYVQAKHWGVGFMSSWRARKTPEFVVVLPIFGFSVIRYLATWASERKSDIRSLGGVLFRTDPQASDIGSRRRPTSVAVPSSNPSFAAFWYHAVFLMIFGILFVYILTLLRFLCSSTPVIFWAAVATLQDIRTPFGKQKSKAKMLEFRFEPATPLDLLKNIRFLYKTKEVDALAIHVFYVFWGLFGIGLFCNFITPP